MRMIDLIKNVIDLDLSNTPNSGPIKILGLTFDCLYSTEVNRDYGLIGETKIIRRIIDNDQYYSVGIGANKLKGWIKFNPS